MSAEITSLDAPRVGHEEAAAILLFEQPWPDGRTAIRVHFKFGSLQAAEWASEQGITPWAVRQRIERGIGLGQPPPIYVTDDLDSIRQVESRGSSIGYTYDFTPSRYRIRLVRQR